MQQTRTELILQFISMLIALGIPLAYFYFPGRVAEIDVWVQAVGALLAAVGVIVVGWTSVQFSRTRSEERTAIVGMINYWSRKEDGEPKDGEVLGAVLGAEFLE